MENNNGTEISKAEIALLAQNHFYFKVSQGVNNYYAPFIIVIGLIGNTISFLVMIKVSITSVIIAVFLCKVSVKFIFEKS